MKNALILTETQTHFLQENRQDPITGDGFSLGNEIVFCAECKSAFLRESWEYMDGKHCNQRKTLSNFPKTSTPLQIQKNITSNYSDDRSIAFLLDLLIALACAALMYFVLSYLKMEKESISIFTVSTGFLYIVFRDCILGDSSIGKKTLGFYFVNNKTNGKARFEIFFVRNLIYWIPMSLIGLFLFQIKYYSTFSLFIVTILLILHIIQTLAILTNQFSVFDKLLGVKLIQKNNNAIKK